MARAAGAAAGSVSQQGVRPVDLRPWRRCAPWQPLRRAAGRRTWSGARGRRARRARHGRARVPVDRRPAPGGAPRARLPDRPARRVRPPRRRGRGGRSAPGIRTDGEADDERQGGRHRGAHPEGAVQQDVGERRTTSGAARSSNSEWRRAGQPRGAAGEVGPRRLGTAAQRGVRRTVPPGVRMVAEEPGHHGLLGRGVDHAHGGPFSARVMQDHHCALSGPFDGTDRGWDGTS